MEDLGFNKNVLRERLKSEFTMKARCILTMVLILACEKGCIVRCAIESLNYDQSFGLEYKFWQAVEGLSRYTVEIVKYG